MKYNKETEEYELTTPLEKEFQKLLKEADPLIEAEIENARKALERAKEISEKYGVPFDVSMIGARNTWCPKSFKKFESMADDDDSPYEFWEFFGVSKPEYGWSPGRWQTSYC
jgi:hypothetical protein